MAVAYFVGRRGRPRWTSTLSPPIRLGGAADIEGAIAHELADVKHRDILISSVAATVAAAIMMDANPATAHMFIRMPKLSGRI